MASAPSVASSIFFPHPSHSPAVISNRITKLRRTDAGIGPISWKTFSTRLYSFTSYTKDNYRIKRKPDDLRLYKSHIGAVIHRVKPSSFVAAAICRVVRINR